MGDLRKSLLRTQLQKELAKARKMQKEGDQKGAGFHFTRAGAISKKLAEISPKRRAEAMYHNAGEYEDLGRTLQSGQARGIAVDKGPADKHVADAVIDNLIVSVKPDITWEQIGGLPDVKRTIKEAIILPFIKEKPPFIKSTRTILLYGPPGTGKTLLAKAASNTLSATFFEARISSLLSKYFGESSKLIYALFHKARKEEPSVVFMDELDSVATARGGGMNEATRRVLGEFLTQIEGFNTKKDEKVLIIGATNKPWDLDEAIISRFQRKIYVPLPDEMARKAIFKIHLESAKSSVDLGELARRSEGFSGRDISSVCQEAINHMVREMNTSLTDLTSKQVSNYRLRSRPLSESDFQAAFSKIKPATKMPELKKYGDWQKDFGG